MNSSEIDEVKERRSEVKEDIWKNLRFLAVVTRGVRHNIIMAEKVKKRMNPDAPMPVNPPQWLVEALRRMGGSSLTYCIGKVLDASDVSSGQSRLQLGSEAVKRSELLNKLSKEEKALVAEGSGLEVRVLDSQDRRFTMRFKRMSSVHAYRLIKGWNNFRMKNALLQAGQLVHLWAFRVKQGGGESNDEETDGELWLAIEGVEG